ncbi:MAG: KH domain-containing protein [Candidatus Magasanikbacteria bacterium]|nr:KH domain-containing protein [Candidatus Magasanikbacteria bacterium]
MEQDQQFIEFVIKAIVNHPDKVKATRTVDERGVLITLDLEPTDIGYVIGRRGNTVRAIRTLLKVVGAKNNAFVNLKINEPEGSEHRRPQSSGSYGASSSSSSYSSTPASAPKIHDDVDTSAIDNLDI